MTEDAKEYLNTLAAWFEDKAAHGDDISPEHSQKIASELRLLVAGVYEEDLEDWYARVGGKG